MKRSIAALLIAILTVFVLSAFDFAPSAGVYVYDDGDYLTAEEEAAVQADIETCRKKIKADILVVFTGNPSAGSQTAAEAVTKAWVNSGKGYGKDQATITWYVDMAAGDVYLDEYSAKEDYKLKTTEIDAITAGASVNYLSEENYGSAARQAVSDIRDAAKPGFFQTILGWLVTGAAGGGIATLFGKAKHGTASAPARRYYLKDGKATVLHSEERFTKATKEVIDHTEKETADREKGASGDIAAGEGKSEHHQGGGASFKKQ